MSNQKKTWSVTWAEFHFSAFFRTCENDSNQDAFQTVWHFAPFSWDVGNVRSHVKRKLLCDINLPLLNGHYLLCSFDCNFRKTIDSLIRRVWEQRESNINVIRPFDNHSLLTADLLTLAEEKGKINGIDRNPVKEKTHAQ